MERRHSATTLGTEHGPVMNSSGSGSELLSEELDFFFSQAERAVSRSMSGRLQLGPVPECRTETIRISGWGCEGDAARGLQFSRWTCGGCNQKCFCPFYVKGEVVWGQCCQWEIESLHPSIDHLLLPAGVSWWGWTLLQFSLSITGLKYRKYKIHTCRWFRDTNQFVLRVFWQGSHSSWRESNPRPCCCEATASVTFYLKRASDVWIWIPVLCSICVLCHIAHCYMHTYTVYICTAHRELVSRAGAANVRSHLNSNGAQTQQQRDESDVQRKWRLHPSRMA